MSEFSSYTRCVGCCCCSCSCYVFFFFRFFVLRFGMAFIFLFVFSYLCENAALVCVVTLPPFWHSQQQREQYHSKRAARQLSKFENERESAPHRTQPNTDTNTNTRRKRVRERKRQHAHILELSRLRTCLALKLCSTEVRYKRKSFKEPLTIY